MAGQEITLQTKEIPTFVKKKHELDKLLKSIEKVSPEAVKLLTDTMNNEKIELKVRIDCAKTIIELNKSLAQQISADEMARLIAEVKLGSGTSKTLTLEDKPKAPALNFEDIREV